MSILIYDDTTVFVGEDDEVDEDDDGQRLLTARYEILIVISFPQYQYD